MLLPFRVAIRGLLLICGSLEIFKTLVARRSYAGSSPWGSILFGSTSVFGDTVSIGAMKISSSDFYFVAQM
jgi:hypothetical protein